MFHLHLCNESNNLHCIWHKKENSEKVARWFYCRTHGRTSPLPFPREKQDRPEVPKAPFLPILFFLLLTVIPGQPIHIYSELVNEELFKESKYALKPETRPPTLCRNLNLPFFSTTVMGSLFDTNNNLMYQPFKPSLV